MQERNSERNVEQIDDAPGNENVTEDVAPGPAVTHTCPALVFECVSRALAVIYTASSQVVPHERVHQRTVLAFSEGIVESIRIPHVVPHERVHHRTVSSFKEEIAENIRVPQVIPH